MIPQKYFLSVNYGTGPEEAFLCVIDTPHGSEAKLIIMSDA